MLTRLFLEAATAVTRRLESAGLPLTATEAREYVEIFRSDNGQGWSYGEEDRDVNILRSYEHDLDAACPLLDDAAQARLRDCAARMAQGMDTAPFDAFLSPGRDLLAARNDRLPDQEFADDPAEWLARHVLTAALREHLGALPSVASAGPAEAEAFSTEVLEVSSAEAQTGVVRVFLDGLDLAADEYTEGAVTLRRITADEMIPFFRGSGWDEDDPPETVLQLPVTSPRGQTPQPANGAAQALVTALQLHGYRCAGPSARQDAAPSWVSGGWQPLSLIVPAYDDGWRTRHTKHHCIDAEGFRTVVATSRRLGRQDLIRPQSSRDLALHRFSLGLSRDHDSNADAILDFTIALEALLLPYDANARRGDLSYRFRMHGAHYLAPAPDARRDTAKSLTRIYETRSRLVHGGKYPAEDETAEVRDHAYELARRGLLRAVTEGFPTAEAFNGMVLGSS
ncbi:hypothetical protein [Actinoplanes sp. NPDC023714]|uniref:hypothetical protein n=1 Tax=Actinoplanes sp. NPDC023714 TaxID=3154322 RepID=UPI00340F3DCC